HRPVPRGAGSAARLLHLHLRRQLETAGRERRRRVPRLLYPLELRGHDRTPHLGRVRQRDQGNGRRYLGQAGRRLLLLRPRTSAAVDVVGQPAGPSAVAQARRTRGGVRREEGRVHGGRLPKPVPVPERVRDGPVLQPDPALPADLGGQDRGHHLLHRAQGRERRGPRQPDPPIRGLLQRHRHGHPGRPGGVPLLPEDLPGHRFPLERPQPRRHSPAQRPRRDRTRYRPGPRALQRRQDRGRGPLPDSARLLARRDGQGPGRGEQPPVRGRHGKLRAASMTITDPEAATTAATITRTEVEDFLYREARLLDDRRFEEWLDYYHPDAEYWMPAWDDNGHLTEDPQREISLI